MDPCSLLTSEQLAELALNPKTRRGTTTAGDDACSFDAQDRRPPEIAITVMTVLDHDAEDLYGPFGDGTIIDVAGFPAVQQPADPGGPRPCTVFVSTAHGTVLRLWLTYASTEAHLSGEEACALTVKVATFAMQTLQEQR